MKLFRRGLRDVGAHGFKLPVVHVVLCQPLYLGTGPPYHKTQKKFPGPGKFFSGNLSVVVLGTWGPMGLNFLLLTLFHFSRFIWAQGLPNPKTRRKVFFAGPPLGLESSTQSIVGWPPATP